MRLSKEKNTFLGKREFKEKYDNIQGEVNKIQNENKKLVCQRDKKRNKKENNKENNKEKAVKL